MKLNTLPEISDKMATVCLVICIRLIRNDFHFHEKKHRTQTFFQKLQKAGSSGTVCRPLDDETSQLLTFWWHIHIDRVFLKYTKSYSKLIALYVSLGKLKRCWICPDVLNAFW